MARNLASALSVIGEPVQNLRGDRLGRIDDVLFDAESGQVLYAIVASGGFGRAEKSLRAIPWRALRVDSTRGEYVLDAERHELDAMPSFSRDEMPDLSDPHFESSGT